MTISSIKHRIYLSFKIWYS